MNLKYAQCQLVSGRAQPSPDEFVENTSPLISVLVPVLNRRTQLKSLLTALSEQTIPRSRFEVVVCDDGSTEDILAELESAFDKFGMRIRYLRQTRKGPGAARNLAIAFARGRILAFTDSDCIPNPDWLESMLDAFSDPSVSFVGGRVGFEDAESLIGQCQNFLMSSSFGAAGARNPDCRVAVKYHPRTPNLGVRRCVAIRSGGFPEVRTLYGEDMAFSERILQQGVKAEYLPHCFVLHNEIRTFSQVVTEACQKGRTRIRIARCLKMHEWIHALPAGFALWCLFTLGSLFFSTTLALLMSLPLAFYGICLVLTAFAGCRKLRSVASFFVLLGLTPFTHLAYGVGYLYQSTRLGNKHDYNDGADWDALAGEDVLTLEQVHSLGDNGVEMNEQSGVI